MDKSSEGKYINSLHGMVSHLAVFSEIVNSYTTQFAVQLGR